ncbi:MAG: RnfABCDGE type electron transport complex subunit D, partial [Spirochaetes bacterium]
MVRSEEVNEGFLVTGFIFPLILPPGIPLWMVAVGIVFGVIVGKEMFGGTGRNLFNPALIGRVFLAVGYPATMTSAWISTGDFPAGRLLSPFTIGMPEGVTSATALVQAKGGVFASTFDLFIGHITGSTGETSALAIIAGGLFPVAIGVANWRTVLSILASFVISGAILGVAFPDIINPPLFNLLSGGFLFGTFFMATDPVSSPVTQRGKIFYGILIGI